MKVLVLDSGGRGHAIAWMFKQDPRVKEVICSPGNAGIDRDLGCIPADSKSPEEFLAIARKEKVDLVFVGPEGYLSKGIVDVFSPEKIPIIGPSKEATILETSKGYTKILCQELGIPIANFWIFQEPERAKQFVSNLNYQVVVKADGLAEGKGSIVCSTKEEALSSIDRVFQQQAEGKWGGNSVVIEKRLFGTEVSFFFITDGYTFVPMPVAQDFKRAFDNDEGPNTGGMGGYSPHLLEGPDLTKRVTEMVTQPLIEGFREKRGILYQGILYLGLMLVDGIPHVLEVNVRHGDPEAEVILPRLKTSPLEICQAILEGKLKHIGVEWSEDYFCDVAAVAGRTQQINSRGRSKGWYEGYPGRYGKGFPISGLEKVNEEKCKIFFAGVANHKEKGLVTDGGRVLHIVAKGKTLAEARDNAYQEIQKVSFVGMRYRKDIGVTYFKEEE